MLSYNLHKGMECASSSLDACVVRDVKGKVFDVSLLCVLVYLLSGVRLSGFEYWLCYLLAV